MLTLETSLELFSCAPPNGELGPREGRDLLRVTEQVSGSVGTGTQVSGSVGTGTRDLAFPLFFSFLWGRQGVAGLKPVNYL